jgi:hypothetical protein
MNEISHLSFNEWNKYLEAAAGTKDEQVWRDMFHYRPQTELFLYRKSEEEWK